MFKITKAAITPGTHPAHVRIRTMRNEPHPRSITANGGKMIAKSTLQNDIVLLFYLFFISSYETLHHYGAGGVAGH